MRLSADTNHNSQVAYSEFPSGRESDWVGLALEVNVTMCVYDIMTALNQVHSKLCYYSIELSLCSTTCLDASHKQLSH